VTLNIYDMKIKPRLLAHFFAALSLQAMIGAASAQDTITLERIGAVRMAPSGAIERDAFLLAEAFRIQTGRDLDDPAVLRVKASPDTEASAQSSH
jgi:hypothetical protein